MAPYVIPEVVAPSRSRRMKYCWSPTAICASRRTKCAGPRRPALEEMLTAAFRAEGITLRRAHPYDAKLKHGFIHSQRMGMEVFEHIHPDAPLVVAEAVWQYSSHLLAGLQSHRGPILTVANWSGQWPGLVGMLNLNGCLRKAGREIQHAVEQGLQRRVFRKGLRQWIKEKTITHDASTCMN